MENSLTKCLAAFRKLYGTQHSLLTMLEKSKRGIDDKAYVSALCFIYGPFKDLRCNQP